jgi:hypothetical protein
VDWPALKRLKFGISATVAAGLLLITPAAGPGHVSAERFQSSSYTIDASAMNSFGGRTTATSYRMETSGGAAAIGNGTAGSYKIGGGYIAELQDSISLTVQASGLKAYFPFNEGVGSALFDESVNANNGKVSSGDVWAGNDGKIGKGITLTPAQSQYIDVPDSSSLTFTNNLTVSGWIRQTSPGGNKAIAAHWDYTGGSPVSGAWAFQTAPSGTALRVMIAGSQADSGNNYVDTAASSWTTGQWNHVAFVYDGTKTAPDRVKVYINGLEQVTTVSGTIAASLQNAAASFRIGDLQGLNHYFNGDIDELKLSSRALTAAEIDSEYDAGNAGIPTALSFASITPGVSRTVDADVAIQTYAPGYNLAIAQNTNLTNGVQTISALTGGGSIASPAAWSEGTTKGLGFSMVTAPGLPAKWNAGSSYAAVPGFSTTFYSRSGFSGGTKDLLSLRYRVDVPASAVAGDYDNQITYSVTVQP